VRSITACGSPTARPPGGAAGKPIDQAAGAGRPQLRIVAALHDAE
jgi:hypothetical protein